MIPEEKWIDPHTCAQCGRRFHGFATRHHEKDKDDRKTGRFVYICRDCHDDEEGVVERHIVRKIAYHKRECQECRDKWNEMINHLKGLVIRQGQVIDTNPPKTTTVPVAIGDMVENIPTEQG